jgi:chromosomal replication initiation ATPase DnaA
MSKILKAIDDAAKEYNVDRECIFGVEGSKVRDVAITAARWRIIYTLRNQDPPYSYSYIGYKLKLDHTTVMNAAKKMKATNGHYFDEDIKNLKQKTLLKHEKRNKTAQRKRLTKLLKVRTTDKIEKQLDVDSN